MRHGNKVNHLGRTYGHRKALLSNLANALFVKKRIITTLAKAKELRVFVEPLLTKAKTNSTHSRRTVFSNLQNKEAVKELFDVIAAKIANRPGGYTRIVRIGNRLGDNAEMCVIELVDFNDIYTTDKKASSAKTKRSRRGGGKAKEESKPVAEKLEEKAAEVEEEVKDVVEEAEGEEKGEE
ncbi:MAG: 50S ribosomal protein L17 [Chitinophagales bacterium]|nr:50S ribosomal protein L17 [Chitinophagales bacterium]